MKLILSFFYVLLSLLLFNVAYDMLPRNGCSPLTGICTDFQYFKPMTIVFYFFSVLFAVLALRTAMQGLKPVETNQYNSKDLGDLDG